MQLIIYHIKINYLKKKSFTTMKTLYLTLGGK